MQTLIRKANKEDLGNVREFLNCVNLGTDGLTEESVGRFWLLEDQEGKIVGSLGMEVFETCGLLRSLVVSPGQVEKEIFLLFTHMLQTAKEEGVEHVYLATNKRAAQPFFDLLGFRGVEREELPCEFAVSEHIRHILNVDNSFFLKLSL